MKRLLTGGAVAMSLAASPVFAANNVMFIMDASNSMWGQLDGVAKIEIAKDALGNLLGDLPSDTQVGLMAYGHRNAEDCADVQVLAPLGSSSVADVASGVQSLTPRGKTPIAATLQASAATFAGVEGPKSVVLVSDGIETCDGDPCAAAEALANAGVGVRVHVVGLDLNPSERAQIECIAERGNGRYFDAGSVEDFAEAIQEAVEETQRAEAPVVQLAQATTETVTDAAPVRELLFVEDFDGFDLSESWQVVNPNPDNFIVEDGALLAISSKNTRMSNPEAENIFVLDYELPRGDFDIVFTFDGELQTGRDLIEVGLYRDPQNYLNARLYTNVGGVCASAFFGNEKMSNGESTRFDYELGGCGTNNSVGLINDQFVPAFASGQTTITYSKRGRSYTAKLDGPFDFNGDGNAWAPEAEALTSLRVPGQIAVAISKWDNADGELLILLDKIEVFAVE